jgi:hypothetical protein
MNYVASNGKIVVNNEFGRNMEVAMAYYNRFPGGDEHRN